jgi:hypothetical protein
MLVSARRKHIHHWYKSLAGGFRCACEAWRCEFAEKVQQCEIASQQGHKYCLSLELQDVSLNEYTAVFKSALDNCGNVGIVDKFLGAADRLFQSTGAVNFNATGEQLTCKQANLTALLHDRHCGGVRLRGSPGSCTCQ